MSSSSTPAATPAATPLSPQDAADVAVLDATLFRFASCEDDKLEPNVARVLPKLLPLFLRPSIAVRDKLILICNHVNKRMLAIPTLKLPVQDFLTLYHTHSHSVEYPAGTSMFITFCLMYVEKGFARLSIEERCALAHQLLPGIGMRAPAQQRTLLHVFFRTFHPSDYHLDRVPPEVLEARWKPIRESTLDQEVLLEFMLDVLLWQPVVVAPAAPMRIPGMPQPLPTVPVAASAAAADPALPPPIPDGLSAAALATLTLDQTLPSSALQLLKSSCLHFLNTDIFTQNQMLPLAIAGSSVGSNDVVHAGDAILKRLKNIELDDTKLVQKLFEMYLGSMDSTTLEQSKKRKPVNYTMKLKLLNYLLRSKLSVTMIQLALKVIMDTLFSPLSTPKMKNVGLMYLGWFMNHQPNPQNLYAIAPIILNALLKFLATCKQPAAANPAAGASSAAASGEESQAEKQTSTSIIYAQLRGQAYHLIGTLSLHRSELFNKNMRMLQLFFQALQDESNDSTLQNIHEGLSMLRSSYVGVDRAIQDELQTILLTMLTQSDRRVRLNALQCFNRLFPYQDILSRYICIYLSNDSAMEIRDEAARGLTPFQMRNELEAERERMKKKRAAELKAEEAKRAREAALEEGAEAKSAASEDAMEDVPERTKSPDVASPTPVAAASSSSSSSSPPVNANLSLLRPIEAAAVPYPSFRALVSFAHAHIVGHASTFSSTFSSAEAKQLTFLKASLAFDVRTLPRLLDYLADTLKQNAFYAMDGKEKLSTSAATAMDVDDSVSSTKPAATKTKSASGLTDDEITNIVSSYARDLLAEESAANVAEGQGSLLKFQALIEHALEQRVHDVQSNAAQHLVRLVALTPTLFAPVYAGRLAWIENNMLSGIQLLRSAMADLLNLIASSLQPDSVVLELLQRFSSALTTSEKIVGPSRDDTTHGCVLALGVLVGEALRRNQTKSDAFPVALLQTIVLDIARRLDAATLTRTPHITAAAIISLGRIGEVSQLPIPEGEITPIGETVKPVAGATPTTRSALVVTLFTLLRGTERKGERVVEESIKTLSLLCVGDSSLALLNQVVEGFVASANIKHEELHFAIGEALSVMTKKHSYPLPAAPASSPTASLSLAPPAEAASSSSSSSASASSNVIPASTDLLAYTLPRLFRLIAHGSSLQRTAAATWLLCLVKFRRDADAITRYFAQIQASFSLALTDSNQFIQEVAAKGMSVLYEGSSGEIQQELIDSLMKTFSTGTRKVTGDSLVAIDEENGEFSTYKELVEVAKDMQKPDLVYNFLDLAAHHSIWSSKLGAAFSLSSILQVNNKLSSQLGDIIPKLYRYQFDTNKKIQDSMKKMWLSLVSNPREAIQTHFDAIMTDLLESMSNRQYRVRNSSCLALCELLPHRGMDVLSPYLEQLWSTSFRNLDDVNEHVRKSATQLANVLSHLSVRLCDTKYSNRVSAQKALSIVVPVLLSQGITSKAKEIQSISIRSLLAIIKIGGVNLRPYLATLVGTLIESYSNLESQVFSYLQFHSASMGMTDEQIERARVSMAGSGVLADAVASCLLVVDEESVPSILTRLTEIITTGIGLPTLTASAKFIQSLVNSKSAPAMRDHVAPVITALMTGLQNDSSPTLRKVYADTLGYLCRVAKKKRVEKLLQSLVDSYISEKSTESSRLISGYALRSIVRQAGDIVRSNFMVDLVPVTYLASHDAGSAVAVSAANPNAQQSEMQKVWSEAFEELIPGLEAGIPVYQKECNTLCVKLLDSSVYALRHIALLTLKHLILACKLQYSSELPTTLPVLLKLLPGRLWTGKEVALDVLAILSQECHTRMTPSQARSVVSIVAAELSRAKTEYRREAVRCYGKIVSSFPYLSGKETIEPVKQQLDTILELTVDSKKEGDSAASSSSSSASAKSATDEEKKGPDTLLISHTYAALSELLPSPQSAITALHILRTSSSLDAEVKEDDWYTVQTQYSEWILDRLLAGLEKGFAWTVRVTILQSLKRFFESLYLGEELAPTTAGDVVPKKSYGASLARPEFLAKLITSLLKPTGLQEPKYPLVKGRAMEVLQIVADKPALWSALIAPSNLPLARDLNQQLIAMRSDTEATTLRLGPAIQSKLAAAIA